MNTALIKELRERTGVGFGDCKKALVEAEWDMGRAVDIVRRQSGAKAEKKADRTASEGLLGLALGDDKGAVVEINVETDFAARSAQFGEFVERAVAEALANGSDGLAESLEDDRRTLVQEIGENVSVRRARTLAVSDGVVAGYLHQDRKKAALVALSGGNDANDCAALARDIAMHVTAMRPVVVSPEDMPEEAVAKEREILVLQAAESGKPPQIVERMVDGRVRKFLAESSLTEQPFVKDTSTTVGKLLKSFNATCAGFERFEVGEGLDSSR